MTHFLFYLLKSAACLIPFYALFVLVLRKLTFFPWNRYYLLTSLIISMLIPILPTGRPALRAADESVAILNHAQAPSVPAEMQATQVAERGTSATVNWYEIAFFVYLAGAAFTWIVLVSNLWKVYSLIGRGEAVRYGKMSVIFSADAKLPIASFFSHVFLSREGLTEDDISQILAHEASHARRFHSLDIMFIELVKVLWWFNPVVYFFKNSLQQIHEYSRPRCLQAV